MNEDRDCTVKWVSWSKDDKSCENLNKQHLLLPNSSCSLHPTTGSHCKEELEDNLTAQGNALKG